MWCWNRCITKTTLGRTSAELELSLPAFLPVFPPQSPPQPPAFSSFDQFLSCTSYGILPDNLNLICFPSCLILISWCSPEVRHWWQLSYRIYTNNPVPLLSFFFLLVNEKTGNIFSSPTPPLPTMLFLFLFGSLDKHLLCESDKPYPKPQRELQPKATNWGWPWDSAQAGLHQAGIAFHMFWLKLVKM